MPIINLVFNDLDAANPATTLPTGYAKPAGSDNAKIFSGPPKVFGLASGSTAMWYNTTELTGNVIKVGITLPTTPSSDPVGCAFINTSGNGFMVITGTGQNNFRIFAVTNGQLTGSALMTAAVAPVGSASVQFWRTINGSDYQYEVFQNSVKIGTTYTNNTVVANYGAVVSRPNGAAAAFSVEFTAAQTIETLTDPLVVGGTFSGTTTGFTDGGATLSLTGQSVAVTVASNGLSGSLPAFIDGDEWPTLPAEGVQLTLTQGAATASVFRNIDLPAGFNVTRGTDTLPANFSGIITDDQTYLGYWFALAGNPLTVNDRCYFPIDGGFSVARDSGVTATTYPLTVNIFIHRADGNVYEHQVLVEEASVIVNPPTSRKLKSLRFTFGVGF